MEVIYRGAESIIYLSEMEGRKVIIKERIKKGYRIECLDEKLRKERTKKEVRLLRSARECGILTPQILEVSDNKIVMEFVDGVRVKEFLNSANKEEIERVCFEIGKLIGKLHSNKIVHGDLTTSNMILKEGKIYFIDFSLGNFSNRIEDYGVDLNLLYEALRSTHFKILEICWNKVIEGYRTEFSNADNVLKKVEEIEKRARYMERS